MEDSLSSAGSKGASSRPVFPAFTAFVLLDDIPRECPSRLENPRTCPQDLSPSSASSELGESGLRRWATRNRAAVSVRCPSTMARSPAGVCLASKRKPAILPRFGSGRNPDCSTTSFTPTARATKAVFEHWRRPPSLLDASAWEASARSSESRFAVGASTSRAAITALSASSQGLKPR